MKIKFGTDDNLPLNKPLKLHLLTIIVRCIFEEDSKFYPQHYLDDCLYELYKCCSTKKNDVSEGIDANKTNTIYVLSLLVFQKCWILI